jgi:hypothetical protein
VARQKITEELEAQIVALYTQNTLTLRQITLETKVGRRKVHAVLLKRGLIRSPKEAAKARKLEQRRCKHCNDTYTPSLFRQVYCKTCCPDKTAFQRLRYYDLSQPEFDMLISEQRGCCPLCDKPLVHGGSNGLNIDHDHCTKQVRGILCHRCNITLGIIEQGDWKERLKRISSYLERCKSV